MNQMINRFTKFFSIEKEYKKMVLFRVVLNIDDGVPCISSTISMTSYASDKTTLVGSSISLECTFCLISFSSNS